MSLTGKNLGVIDTLDMLVEDGTTGQTMYSGITTKAGIQQKTTAVDIWGGIGQQHLAKLRTKKEITVTGNIVALDMNFLASQNGVPLLNDQTGSIYFNDEQLVTGNTLTINGCSQIFSVQRKTGEFLTLGTQIPTKIDEAQVTYPAGASGTQQVNTLTVTTAPTSAGDVTIEFNNGTTTITKTVALLATDTVSSTATKIASAFTPTTGYLVTNATSSADVLFTASLPSINTLTTITLTDTGVTHAVGSSVQTIAGIAPTVSNSTLTFSGGFSDGTVLVTYKAPPIAGKDNLVVKINANTFPRNAQVILKGVVYDYDSENIVGDIKVIFYKCSISPDWNLAFEMGKAIDTVVSLDVLLPSTVKELKDGQLIDTINTDKSMCQIEVTER
jgi:hypothetical protein